MSPLDPPKKMEDYNIGDIDIPENVGLKKNKKIKWITMVCAGPHQYAENFKNKGINLFR